MTKPSLSLDAVSDFLVSQFGPAIDLRRLSEGMESQAFAFRRGREDFVLRINADREGFLKDRRAQDRFAAADLPIPEVVDIGPFDARYAYCISRLCPGITLQDLAPDALAAVLTPTADALAATAAANLTGTSGYGPWDSAGHARYGSWRDFVLDIPEPGEGVDSYGIPLNSGATAHHVIPAYPAGPAQRSRGISRRGGHGGTPTDVPESVSVLADRLRTITGEIRRHVDAYPEERRLIHGDFGSNNVLSDGRGITGVIDWSESMYGDPLYDVANVFFWRSWLPCMEAQARFFEESELLTADRRNRLRCYALRIGVLEVVETTSDAVVQWAVTRCDQLMAGEL